MGLMRAAARLVEALTRRDVVQLSAGWDGSFALVNRAHRDEAWYSQRHQLAAVLSRCDIDLVIDAGANEGSFAKLVRRFYPGTIVSFEPVAEPFAILSKAAASDPNWHVRQLALGNEDGDMAIHISDTSLCSSLLLPSDYGAARFGTDVVPGREEHVTVRRLDGVLDELTGVTGNRIFLKLDTQGYDVRVFEGLGQRVTDVMAMQSEVSLIPIYEGMTYWTESIAVYEAAGFRVVGFFPISHDNDGRVIEYDCLMQRELRPAVEPPSASGG